MKLNILVVLYNKNISDSIAITSILNKLKIDNGALDCVSLHVWNNGPEYFNDDFHRGVVLYEGNNTPLPLIYNDVASKVLSDDEALLMISDDDTDYTNYDMVKVLSEINEITSSVKKDLCTVFTPKIYSNDILVSPGTRFLFKGKRLDYIEDGLQSSENFIAINSGVIFTSKCYKKMSMFFNPALKFYGTDTDFFVRYEKYFEYIYVLSQSVNHELSENLNETVDRSYFRWQDHIYATRVTFSCYRAPISYMLAIYLIYLKVKLAFKYKCLRYLYI